MIRKIISVIIMSIICVVIAPYAAAEDTAAVSWSKGRTSLGDTVTATVTFTSSDYDIADIQGNITYNDKVLEFVSSDSVTIAGGGNLTFHAFTDNGASNSYSMSITFNTIGVGDGFVRLINCRITDNMQNGVRSPSAEGSIDVTQTLDTTVVTSQPAGTTTTTAEQTTTTALTTQEEETTTSAETTTSTAAPADGEIPEGKLRSVSLSTGYITPAFSYDVLEYEIKVAPDCTWLELLGETSREGEYIWYTGDENVYDGIITRTITVRDSEGNETVYTFNISRMTAEELEEIESTEQPPAGTEPAEDNTAVTSTTRKLSLEKNSGTLKKTIAAVGAVIIVVLVIIIAVSISRSSDHKRKKIKKSK